VSRDRGAVGRRWEQVVGEYLQARGLAIVARGYRCRLGEIDLVCRDGTTLVIVEVRARSSTALVRAKETVDHGKRRRLVQAARHFLTRHPRFFDRPIRFDVVAIDGIDGHRPDIDWIKNAFDAG
jgi:putative endonuclease